MGYPQWDTGDPEGEDVRIASAGWLSVIYFAHRTLRHLSVPGIVWLGQPSCRRAPEAARRCTAWPEGVRNSVERSVGAGHDLLMEMERVIDLDQAAAVISERAGGWLAAGLTVGQVTWLDANSPWPREFETDRALVPDPVSIGVLIDGPAGAGLSVVLFRGGWADVDYFDGIDDGGQIPAFGITSAAAFGTQLDQWMPRAFGNLGKNES